MDDDAYPDCTTTVAQTWWFLDGECSPGVGASLTRHLNTCAECWTHYFTEARMKILVATKASGECAPERLRNFCSKLGE